MKSGETILLEELLSKAVPYIITVLEFMGVFIIAYSGLKTFYLYLCSGLHSDSHDIKLAFARNLAFALEFKLGGEILRTVITKKLDEMYVLAAIIILRAILTFVIHWEIKFDTDNHIED